MANIRLTPLRAQKESEFKVLGSRMERFNGDFQDAVNDVIAQINLYASLATVIAAVTSIEGTVGLDELYRYPFTQLVSLRLWEMGQRPAKGGEPYYNDLKAEKEGYVDMIRQGILDAAIAADTDDETDFIGLGALNA